MKLFHLAHGGTYTVGGEPVVVSDLTGQLTKSIVVLLLAAVLVMAFVLVIVFRSRPRLLPLVIALIASGIAFGIVRLIGASLTMASIAVLPVMIGLSVDYTVQFQSRSEEARRRVPGIAPADAAALAARTRGPPIVAAALATATGFLALLLSPVPMVRGVGLLLVLGIAIALVCTLQISPAALALGSGRARGDGATTGPELEVHGPARGDDSSADQAAALAFATAASGPSERLVRLRRRAAAARPRDGGCAVSRARSAGSPPRSRPLCKGHGRSWPSRCRVGASGGPGRARARRSQRPLSATRGSSPRSCVTRVR